MENSLKGLILAAGTIITCLVISLGFYISNEAQATASTGTSQIGKINSEFADNSKSMYDGNTVSGNEVVNAIKKFDGEEIGIYVVTKSSSTFYGYTVDVTTGELKTTATGTYNKAVSTTSSTYINPYASFKGSIIKNSNGVITGIKFTQK